MGNASEVCGGSLSLTLYNLTRTGKTSAAAALSNGDLAWGLGASAALVGVMSAVFVGL